MSAYYFIAFGLGYFLARLVTPKPQHNVLLAWDPEVFGWRPVVDYKNLDKDKRYMAAFELDTEAFIEAQGKYEIFKND